MVASTSCESLLPLDLMKAGESASIVELHGDSSQVHRLQEMGLRAGAVIRMLKPGAPCLVCIGWQTAIAAIGWPVGYPRGCARELSFHRLESTLSFVYTSWVALL